MRPRPYKKGFVRIKRDLSAITKRAITLSIESFLGIGLKRKMIGRFGFAFFALAIDKWSKR